MKINSKNKEINFLECKKCRKTRKLIFWNVKSSKNKEIFFFGMKIRSKNKGMYFLDCKKLGKHGNAFLECKKARKTRKCIFWNENKVEKQGNVIFGL